MSTPSSRPRALRARNAAVLTAGLTRYELVRTLEKDQHGELLLVRLRFATGPGGYAVLKRLYRVTTETGWHRLQEEARLLSQLSHPNISGVHQLNGTSDQPLLLMEYVPGQRLDEVYARAHAAGRSMPESLACYVAAEVAEALHHVHTFADERGSPLEVVHRDVTPHSIFLGQHGEVKLMGFGLAWSQLAGRHSSESPSFQGSLAYASPEHASLQTKLDGRSDLFSLGVVLLELVTGRHLFDAQPRFLAELRLRRRSAQESKTRNRGEMNRERTQELLARIATLRPAAVEEALQPVSEGLRNVLRRALAPNREERFPTGEALAGALREHLWRSGHPLSRAHFRQELRAFTSARALLPLPSRRAD